MNFSVVYLVWTIDVLNRSFCFFFFFFPPRSSETEDDTTSDQTQYGRFVHSAFARRWMTDPGRAQQAAGEKRRRCPAAAGPSRWPG